MNEQPDDTLMIRFADGDEGALRILVERWERQLFAFLVQMLDSPEEAEDLCQDTFMRLIQAAPRYKPEGRFQSWLFRIAGNLARSRLRRRKILKWLPLSMDHQTAESPGRDPLDSVVDHQEMNRIREAIERLPVRQRQALILKQYHELNYRDIADAMDTTVGSIQMLLHRAMSSLRNDLIRGGGK